ncbi:MAG: HAMP domain-containing sensor histidine kinase [Treponemataceae bacterium]
MKRRHVAALAFAFVVPMVLALALAASAVRDGRERARIRASDAASARLEAASARIAAVASEWDAALLHLSDGLDGNRQALRKLSDGHPWVRQAFWLDANARLVFPDAATSGLRETEFLARSELLFAAGLLPAAREAGGVGTDHGWSSYWWREGSQWVFWKAKGVRGYAGLELNRYVLLSDLSARLDPAVPRQSENKQYRLRLEDDRGAVFAVWGGYVPAEGARPLASSELPKPFSGWTLRYDMDEQVWAAEGRASLIALALGALGVLFAAAALAVYVFRGFADELKLAGQRVSFVNQVSHELKTPLTNIRLYAELLAKRLPEGGSERGYLDVIEREGRRLSRLINNVLTFGRETRGSAENLCLRPDSIDAAVERVLDAFRPSFEEREMMIDARLNAGGTVMIDADLIDQVVGNLLSNAEKYAASGRIVTVETGREEERAWVRVKDRGPGIKKEDRPRLFLQFERFHVAVTDAVGGTGLGLYLSRVLARRHGGDLVLEETETGSSFLFIFCAENNCEESI